MGARSQNLRWPGQQARPRATCCPAPPDCNQPPARSVRVRTGRAHAEGTRGGLDLLWLRAAAEWIGLARDLLRLRAAERVGLTGYFLRLWTDTASRADLWHHAEGCGRRRWLRGLGRGHRRRA